MLWVHFAVVGGLALAAFVTARRARRPEVAHVLWILVFLKLVVPPTVEVPLLPARDAGLPVLAEVSSAYEDSDGLDLVGAPLARPVLERVELSTPAPAWWSRAETWYGLWGAGALLLLGWVVVSAARFHAEVRSAEPLDGALRDAAVTLAGELGLSRVPEIRLLDRALSPAVWPIGRATILLPRAILQALSFEQVEAILAHELAHIARRDHWTRLLEVSCACLYWWLPPIAWFRRELREVEEVCCDGHVVRTLARVRDAYADALVETAALLSRSSQNTLPRLATGASAFRPLTRRIVMIQAPEHQRPLSRVLMRVVFGAGLVLLPLAPVHATRVQAAEPSRIGDVEPLDLAGLEAQLGRDPVEEQEPPPPPPAGEQALRMEVAKLVEQGRLREAVHRLEDAVTPSTSAELHHLRGRLHLQLESAGFAAGAFEAAIWQVPDHREAWVGLGHAQALKGEHARAIAAFERALELGEPESETYGTLGLSRLHLNDLEGAERAFLMASLLDPAEREWKRGLLETFLAQKRYGEVVALADRMIGEGDEADAREFLLFTARARLGQGDHAGARRAIDRLQRLDPAAVQDRKVLLALSRIAEAEGRRAESVQLLERVLTLEPEEPIALELLGRQLCELGEYERALRYYERLAQLPSSRPEALTRIGQLLVEQKRYREALRYLYEAQELKPRESVADFIEAVERMLGIRSVSELDREPRAIHRPAPVLTPETRRLKGTVTVLFVIDEEGRVESPKVESSTDPALDRPALDAVAKWKFEPGERNGEPVKVRMRVPIQFPGERR